MAEILKNKRIVFFPELFEQNFMKKLKEIIIMIYKKKRHLSKLKISIIISWFIILWYGEVNIFKQTISRCSWSLWEKWEEGTKPYRVALIGDPQLVDKHTYNRSFLLTAFTNFYTDKYMKRNWKYLNNELHPQSLIFLGDLLDGGRDLEMKSWIKEYKRFDDVFFQPPGVKVISTLPGNHDIGFSDGVTLNRLNRFRAYFGESSSSYVLGNHTFVLLDTISLSNTINTQVSEYTKQLLDDLKNTYDKDFPRILLSHVPLFRPANTPCGPNREKNTSIKLERGYQYQNVILSSISTYVLEIVRPIAVFSGDDHDFCEVKQTIKKYGITIIERSIKSFSMAMGISQPGVQLVSLYNPSLKKTENQTFQTKLCLLPKQYYIFSLYLITFIVTVSIICIYQYLFVEKDLQYLSTYTNKYKNISHESSFKSLDHILSDIINIAIIVFPWYLYLLIRY
ncbi:hypothetical protein PNEG_01151 [Pneumocystis murina B123]|uniref:Calcineurin-like phosphoesterase domain-containing protein n=1 Tax=Pneumocystis murina (strain B123) TaxID=1069680 RepID=M7P9A4_PNEMU|nr:hypothetical protein PNEG_01151 [Pneumocystis murina B123]EMR10435.1 hypothetical protein PNEG_01151 [Pneumocystis murina B123]